MTNKKKAETETKNMIIPANYIPTPIEVSSAFITANSLSGVSEDDVNVLSGIAKAQKELVAERSRAMLQSGDLNLYKVITLNDAEKKEAIEAIVLRIEQTNELIQKAKDNYFNLLPDLGKLRASLPSKSFKIDDVEYKNFKQFCMDRFGFSKSTYYNMMKILDYFYDTTTGQLVDGVIEKGIRAALATIDAIEGKTEPVPAEEEKVSAEETAQEPESETEHESDELSDEFSQEELEAIINSTENANNSNYHCKHQRIFQDIDELHNWLNADEDKSVWEGEGADFYLVLSVYAPSLDD